MLAPHAIEGPRLLGELPATSGREKIEVWSRSEEDGSTVLELVEYCWGSGLGWYVQKRVALDPDQVRLLSGLLSGFKPTETPAAPLATPGLKRTAPAASREGNVISLRFPV
jgi:hypothetical protein